MINRANTLYAFISQINQKIVRVKNEETLFRNFCQIAVEYGKFQIAWIGLFDKKNHKVSLIDQSGISVKDINFFTNAPYHANSFQNFALSTGKYYLCNDIVDDAAFKKWKPIAKKYQVRSCMVLPFKRFGEIIGTLNLYSIDQAFFNGEEIELLGQLAEDISFALDIFETAKKHREMEELVLNNEKRFRALIENSADMITLSTRDGEMLYGSPSITKLFGYSLEDIKQIPAFDFIHPEDLRKFIENRAVILQAPGKSFYSQIRLKHKTGNWIWCESTLTNMLDEPGINALVSNFRDISERKEAEQAKMESENLIQTIYAASLDAVIILDSEGIIAKWDAKSESLFGWKEKEVAGMKLAQTIIPERYREMHENGIKRYLKTGKGKVLNKTIEISALKKDGSEFDVSLSITPSQIDGKLCFIGFIRDVSDKKQAEKEREFDKNNLTALINNTSDLMWSVDLDARLITFNQPFYEIVKLLSGKELAKGDDVFSAILSKEQRDRFEILYSRAFAGETFTEIEHTETPVESWSEISYYPIRKGDEVIGTACHARDITGRRKAEEKLRQSKAHLVEAQRLAKMGSWNYDIQTDTLTWSEELYNIFDTDKQTFIETYGSFLHLIDAEDRESALQTSRHAQKTGEPFTIEYRITTRRGEKRILKEHGYSQKDSNGKIMRLFGTAQDITEQVASRKKIEESEERYRQIVETAQEGIWLIDENNKTIFVNKRFSEIFGYSFKEMLGKTNFDLLDDHGKTVVEEKLKQRKRGIAEDFELEYLGKNGKRIWANVSASPILGDKGNYLGGLAMFTDITQRKNAEIEKEKMTADLIQRNIDLEQFAYIISHNLRAPVANILGTMTLLNDTGVSEEEKDLLTGGLTESVMGLDTIVRDLNHILKVKHEINEIKEKVCFSALVNNIKTSIKNLIDEGHIEIEYDFSEIDELVTLKSYLYSIFYNLISNSIKYRQQQVPCRIKIKSHRSGNKVELIFADNGMGMDLQKSGGQVFGLYKRFHKNIEGKGMGLYMVKTQMETLGGKISLKSEVNKGTEFKIEFEIQQWD